ncbi:MAG: plasmid recombination protein [Clostridia bacterium]|nr:plasmid recombination protein [Clostridia bacterium]
MLVKRFPYGKISALERENERAPDYGCMDGHIDDAETKNNYHIVYPKGDYLTLISPYVGKGPGGRKQAYVMSVVVTSDDDYFYRRSEACIWQFFVDATDFMIRKFGRMSVFSAVVHMDEDRPHLHVNFFPYDSEGNLIPLAHMRKDDLVAFQDEIYEEVGLRWSLERGDRAEGIEARVHEEYLQARIMYRYQLEVNDILNLIDSKRREYYALEEAVKGLEDKECTLKRSIRDLTQAQEAMKEESREIRAEILKDIDFHAGMEMACAEDNPSRNKDKSIHILKARNYFLQEKLEAGQAETQELSGRLRDTEGRLKEAEQYKSKAGLADRIMALYPEEWKALCKRADNAREPAGKDTGRAKTA